MNRWTVRVLLSVSVTLASLMAPQLAAASSTGKPDKVVTYFHLDLIGSVVAKSDAHGELVLRRGYEPYGADLDGTEDGPGFTGHVGDTQSGLVYLQQRYYDPMLGMFLSVDPVSTLKDPIAGFSRYRYANSNPYKYVDPDGRKSRPFLDVRETECRATPDCRHAFEGEDDQSKWSAAKSRLGLSGDLTKNGNIFDLGALFHDIAYPAMELPGGKGVKLAGMGFFALKLGPSVGSLAGLGKIGSHGVVDSTVALNSATRWLGKGYSEIAPGIYRSSDGLRQFRMTSTDLKGAHGSIGPHVHFEALDRAGKVVENLHLGIAP